MTDRQVYLLMNPYAKKKNPFWLYNYSYFLKCPYKSFSSPVMNYSENKSSHSLHYIYYIIMHNNKFFINLLASVNNFHCLVKISFKQLLIFIHILKFFSVCMCVCVSVYMYVFICACMWRSEHTHGCISMETGDWHQASSSISFWFNFMGLSLMEQEYQASRPKDHLTSTPAIGWQAPATKLTF